MSPSPQSAASAVRSVSNSFSSTRLTGQPNHYQHQHKASLSHGPSQLAASSPRSRTSRTQLQARRAHTHYNPSLHRHRPYAIYPPSSSSYSSSACVKLSNPNNPHNFPQIIPDTLPLAAPPMSPLATQTHGPSRAAQDTLSASLVPAPRPEEGLTRHTESLPTQSPPRQNLPTVSLPSLTSPASLPLPCASIAPAAVAITCTPPTQSQGQAGLNWQFAAVAEGMGDMSMMESPPPASMPPLSPGLEPRVHRVFPHFLTDAMLRQQQQQAREERHEQLERASRDQIMKEEREIKVREEQARREVIMLSPPTPQPAINSPTPTPPTQTQGELGSHRPASVPHSRHGPGHSAPPPHSPPDSMSMSQPMSPNLLSPYKLNAHRPRITSATVSSPVQMSVCEGDVHEDELSQSQADTQETQTPYTHVPQREEKEAEEDKENDGLYMQSPRSERSPIPQSQVAGQLGTLEVYNPDNSNNSSIITNNPDNP